MSLSLTVTGERKAAESKAAVLPSPDRDRSDSKMPERRWKKLEIKKFLPMRPPTATHQEKQVRVVRGKPVFYEPPEVKAARSKLTAAAAQAAPERPLTGPVALAVWWWFPAEGTHRDGDWRTARPDLDNLNKLLLDCMTAARWWGDDAQVVVLTTGKQYGDIPGLEITARELEGGMDKWI